MRTSRTSESCIRSIRGVWEYCVWVMQRTAYSTVLHEYIREVYGEHDRPEWKRMGWDEGMRHENLTKRRAARRRVWRGLPRTWTRAAGVGSRRRRCRRRAQTRCRSEGARGPPGPRCAHKCSAVWIYYTRTRKTIISSYTITQKNKKRVHTSRYGYIVYNLRYKCTSLKAVYYTKPRKQKKAAQGDLTRQTQGLKTKLELVTLMPHTYEDITQI